MSRKRFFPYTWKCKRRLQKYAATFDSGVAKIASLCSSASNLAPCWSHVCASSGSSCVAVCCDLCCSLLRLLLQCVLADVYTNRERILDSQVATEWLSSCSHPVLWCLTVKHLESQEAQAQACPPYALCHSSLRRPPSRTLLPHNKYNTCPWQCCSTLQHTATLYNTLQHTATHCTTLHHKTWRWP